MLDDALKILRPFDRQSATAKLRNVTVQVRTAVSQAEQAFSTLGEEAVEVIGELSWIDDTDQLDVGLRKHQAVVGGAPADMPSQDRKSTRLNSSHVAISYAVLCLKKKT